MDDRIGPYNFAVIGSSNAAGLGASSYRTDPCARGGWKSPATSWIGKLAASSDRVNIKNFSVSGANSLWAFETAKAVVDDFDIDAILLCTNPISDADDGTTFRSNADKLHQICKSRNMKFIVRGAYSYNFYTSSAYRSMLDLNSYLADHFPRVLDHMTCLSDENGHFRHGDRYHTDGLHPNDLGYDVLFEAARSSLALTDLL